MQFIIITMTNIVTIITIVILYFIAANVFRLLLALGGAHHAYILRGCLSKLFQTDIIVHYL